MLAKAEAVQDWEELGFTSQRDAERSAIAAALMTTSLSARNRQRRTREWARKWKSETTGTQNQERARTATYYGRGTGNNGTGGHQTYNFIARVFHATPIRTIPLENSPTLPHCQFPIGPTHGKGKLTVAPHSCIGVNIGHLALHKAMAETFPELVVTFKPMHEYGENDVTIGGVEVSATKLKLTHIVEYKTPYRYNGMPRNLTFGLSEHAAATAIISIIFCAKPRLSGATMARNRTSI
jgi:hypothetical protein